MLSQLTPPYHNIRISVLLLVVLAVLCPSDAKRCPMLPKVNNLKQDQMSGLWYDVESLPDELERGVTCVTTNITFDHEGMSLNKQGIWPNGERMLFNARALFSQHGNKNQAKFSLLIPGSQKAVTLTVMSTDYKNFALLWACTYGYKTDSRTDWLWVLSRQPVLDPALRVSVYQFMEEFDLPFTDLRKSFSPELCLENGGIFTGK